MTEPGPAPLSDAEWVTHLEYHLRTVSEYAQSLQQRIAALEAALMEAQEHLSVFIIGPVRETVRTIDALLATRAEADAEGD